MSLGKRLLEARKSKKMSQDELAKKVGTKGPAIGRYERDVAQPALDTIVKLSNALDVSLDYLIGKIDDKIDPQNLKRLVAIQKLPLDVQDKILYFIDLSIKDAYAQQVYR